LSETGCAVGPDGGRAGPTYVAPSTSDLHLAPLEARGVSKVFGEGASAVRTIAA
jgi:hypothetical protein